MESQKTKEEVVEVLVINEISSLHNEIIGYLKTSLDKAIRIGQLLTEQKDSLKHGEFTKWISENLPFADRTARRYMRIYNNKDKLKTDRVSDLTSGYRFLTEKREKSFKSMSMQELADYGKEQLALQSSRAVDSLYATRELGKRIIEAEAEGKEAKRINKEIKKLRDVIKELDLIAEKDREWQQRFKEWDDNLAGIIGACGRRITDLKWNPTTNRQKGNAGLNNIFAEIELGFKNDVQEYHNLQKEWKQQIKRLYKENPDLRLIEVSQEEIDEYLRKRKMSTLSN